MEPGQLRANSISENRISISPLRKINAYLPPRYADPGKRFPVISFLSSFLENETASVRLAQRHRISSPGGLRRSRWVGAGRRSFALMRLSIFPLVSQPVCVRTKGGRVNGY
ncbi:hypothetical protein, partial [Sphingomonas sp. ERG5]|uniref:hypothetical protein n=1 Tax=Sphingomonas sp. ERG5 TaxID=1381597 RepID=UPI001F318F6F